MRVIIEARNISEMLTAGILKALFDFLVDLFQCLDAIGGEGWCAITAISVFDTFVFRPAAPLLRPYRACSHIFAAELRLEGGVDLGCLPSPDAL